MSTMKLNVSRGFKMGTKINSVEVPAELRVKHSSGIQWMDDALGFGGEGEGGFTPTTTMMLTGGPGAGKSTLIRQTADALARMGHYAIYNTGEESLFQVKMSCERLGLTENFDVGEETMLPKLLGYLDSVKKAMPGKQIFLLQDSLQTLDDGRYVDKDGRSRGTTGKTPTYCTEMLVDWMQRNFGVCIFIGQCTKGGEFAGHNTIKHAIDVHAELYVDTKEKSETFGQLLFEVSKNRFGCTGKTYILQRGKGGLLEEAGHYENETVAAAAREAAKEAA